MHLQVSDLSRELGTREVVSHVSFTISAGEKVGLVGKNGCGKSTLFRIMAGLESPDGGSVTYSPKGLRVGYLPQVIESDDPVSSGQKTRALLEELLADEPDFLLLDEPTNHLDWSGLEWLEDAVTRFTGGVVVVSHDRAFLDHTVGKILELENGAIKVYGGNYSFYHTQKETEKEASGRRYTEQQKRLGKLESRVQIVKNRTRQLEARTTGRDHYVRRKAAKAAKSAISLEKRIAREIAGSRIPKPEPAWELKALFAPAKESSGTVVYARDVSETIDGRKLFQSVSLLIRRNDRVALIGDNGSGKTTIIKLLLGERLPETGVIERGSNVEIGYLSQEHDELNGTQSIMDELVNDRVDKTQAYKLLHRFLLPPEKIIQSVNSLSSGEKAKLLLAKIMASGANFIVLDEPTNHLDIPTREALEEAIASYAGTLLVVSHDRYFLERINLTRLYLFSDGRVTAE